MEKGVHSGAQHSETTPRCDAKMHTQIMRGTTKLQDITAKNTQKTPSITKQNTIMPRYPLEFHSGLLVDT